MTRIQVVPEVDVHREEVPGGIVSALLLAHLRAEDRSYRVAFPHALAALGVEVGIDGRPVMRGLSCQRTEPLAAPVPHCPEEVVLFHIPALSIVVPCTPSPPGVRRLPPCPGG